MTILIGVTVLCHAQAQDVFEACRKGDTLTLERLHAIRADTLNARNPSGFTPLIIAAYRWQLPAVRFLLRRGARVNDISPEGSALMAAVFRGDIETAAFLLEHGANVNLANEDGVTALMYAVMNNEKAMVDLLLRYGADRHQKDLSGRKAADHLTPVSHKEIREAVR